MTFKEFYLREKSKPVISPGKTFILAISANTGRSVKTVQQWLCGIQEPDLTIKARISQLMKVPVEELFPPRENENG